MTEKHDTDLLAPQAMGVFLASLANLPREEVVKAKLLYLRNAVSEYEADVEKLKAFNTAQFLFYLIPIFWPFLIASKREIKAAQKLARDRIRNAVDVWKDDLAGQVFVVGDETIRA